MSETSSAFEEISFSTMGTPSASEDGSIHHDIPESHRQRSYPNVVLNSPSEVPGILNGNFASITGEIGDGLTIDLSYNRPNVAYAEVRYTYATFPRVPVTVSFGFTQDPAEWHKVASFVADLPAVIRNIIEGMSRTDGGATKLLLVIIFSLVYFNNGPHFWKQARLEAADQLFSFLSAPDLYHCTIVDRDRCPTTAIKASSWSQCMAFFEVSRNGKIFWLTDEGEMAHRMRSHNTFGHLPPLEVNVL